MKTVAKQIFPPLEQVTRPKVPTDAAAYYLKPTAANASRLGLPGKWPTSSHPNQWPFGLVGCRYPRSSEWGGSMNLTDQELSAICETAMIFDLESGYHRAYRDLYIASFKSDSYIKLDSVTHSYLLYWPCGLAAYIVAPLAEDQLRPAFIEAAHATAKQLKPFSPLKKGAR